MPAINHVDRHGRWCGVAFGSDPSISDIEVFNLCACFLLLVDHICFVHRWRAEERIARARAAQEACISSCLASSASTALMFDHRECQKEQHKLKVCCLKVPPRRARPMRPCRVLHPCLRTCANQPRFSSPVSMDLCATLKPVLSARATFSSPVSMDLCATLGPVLSARATFSRPCLCT